MTTPSVHCKYDVPGSSLEEASLLAGESNQHSSLVEQENHKGVRSVEGFRCGLSNESEVK